MYICGELFISEKKVLAKERTCSKMRGIPRESEENGKKEGKAMKRWARAW